MKATLTLFLFVLIGTCSAIFSQTVTIGTQVWMTKNLDVSTFRNGDPIPEAKTDEEWVKVGKNGQPAWCYYDNDPANGEKYGKLYNWYAVNDPRGLAPQGWHVPSDKEWTVLTDYLGGLKPSGSKMKGTSGWSNNGNGTNESGFSGLPGALRFENGSFFYLVGLRGDWWSSTESINSTAYSRNLNHYRTFGGVRSTLNNKYGLSVRCLRD